MEAQASAVVDQKMGMNSMELIYPVLKLDLQILNLTLAVADSRVSVGSTSLNLNLQRGGGGGRYCFPVNTGTRPCS